MQLGGSPSFHGVNSCFEFQFKEAIMEPDISLGSDDVRSKKISVDSGINSEKADETGSIDGGSGIDEVDTPRSREAMVLQEYYHTLLKAMETDIVELTSMLFSAGFISHKTKSDVIDSEYKPAQQKCANVIHDIERRVLLDPPFFHGVLSLLQNEAPEPVKNLAEQMREKIATASPPKHSLSESSAYPRPRRVCIKSAASSPAAFTPELTSVRESCEHCEIHQRAMVTIFDKFCQDYLLKLLEIERDQLAAENGSSSDVDHSFITEQRTQAMPVITQTNVERTEPQIPTTSTPISAEVRRSGNSESLKSLELDPHLFQASPPASLNSQWSYESTCSTAGEEYLSRLLTDFQDRLKQYYQKQRQSKKTVVQEKKVIKEKLLRTEEEFKELSSRRNQSEQELEEACDQVSVLQESLEHAQMRIVQLSREVVHYKQQLQNEQCAHGSSMNCKHFERCSSLEDENSALKKQMKRLEADCNEYRAKIENLDVQLNIAIGKM